MEFRDWINEQIKIGNLWYSKIKNQYYAGEERLSGKYRIKFNGTKKGAKRRGLLFCLQYEDYLYKAYQAGISSPDEIGNSKGNYNLSRHKDKGDYTVSNCRFISREQNVQELFENYDRAKSILSKKQSQRVQQLLKLGVWHTCNILPWNSPRSSINSLEVWAQADECYDWWSLDTSKGYKKVAYYYNLKSLSACNNLIKKFKAGWIPEQDSKWLEFKQEYKKRE